MRLDPKATTDPNASAPSKRRWFKNFWLILGGVGLAVTLISCATNRAVFAPPQIAGATFVGSDTCSQCHEPITRDF